MKSDHVPYLNSKYPWFTQLIEKPDKTIKPNKTHWNLPILIDPFPEQDLPSQA